MSILSDSFKLRIRSVEINYADKIINCICYTSAETHFNKFTVQHDVQLSEVEDFNNNPAWTDDDLKNALSAKTGIPVNEIVFLRPSPINT